MKVKLRRNRHNLTYYHCGTAYPGEIVPVGWQLVNPGDSIRGRINGLVRFMPMNAPIMHRVHAEWFTFFVPARIIWSGFEDFITRVSGASGPPTMTLGDIKGDADCKRLCEYFGINTDSVVAGSTTTVNVMLLQAYYKVVNEWFKDKDLQTPLPETSTTAADYQVQRACWRKDKLTMARPTPQYGAAVTLPLGTTAPIIDNPAVGGGQDIMNTATPGAIIGPMSVLGTTTDALTVSAATGNSGARVSAMLDGGTENAWLADLSSASSSTVLAWRRAMNLQALAERMQNFGHDYRSYLASMGVQSDDGRLQLPELLASGKVPLSFSEVLQTAEGTAQDVGAMYGHGIAAARNAPYQRFFKEHGYTITVMVVRPQAIYNNLISREWYYGLEDGANDYYTPELERIGYQEVLNKEVYPTNPAGGDETVWGYVPRYDEGRGRQSWVSGLFKVGASLDEWTWARGFASLPALNSTFVECNPDSRVFQVTSSDPILFCVNNIDIAQRMLTKNITGRII